MALIKCKAELKFKWTKSCVMSAAGNDNDDVNSDNIHNIHKVTCSCCHFMLKDTQKLSKLLSK